MTIETKASWATRRFLPSDEKATHAFFTWTPRPCPYEVLSDNMGSVPVIRRSPSEARSRVATKMKQHFAAMRFTPGGWSSSSRKVSCTSLRGVHTYTLVGTDHKGDPVSEAFATLGRGSELTILEDFGGQLDSVTAESLLAQCIEDVKATATAGDVSRNIVRYIEKTGGQAFRVNVASDKMWILSTGVLQSVSWLLDVTRCASPLVFPITRRESAGLAATLQDGITGMIERVKLAVDADPEDASYVTEFKEAQAKVNALRSVLGDHAGKLDKVLQLAGQEVRRKVGADAPAEPEQSTEAAPPALEGATATREERKAALLAKYSS